MTTYLTKEDLLGIVERVLPPSTRLRDAGQVHAAVLRPQATAFGEDAYPEVWEKAAALMQSVLIGHPLSDGNKRLAWLSATVFLELNGVRTRKVETDTAYAFVIAVTTGDVVDVPEIAKRLRGLGLTAA
ncbi:death-on-curing protein [Nocardiopsis sp. CNR-923]|uniref:type II toxin-antitoxin system death-on-curing family toxin n=1 Tax=Nocardiopsis sp. CNR-923 TaxID=1904965 RepID=UPI00095F35C3|nr:Fic family protein [Nocardiopsis sp. CNR-923]OLT25568.1 death-on-curing protein [Nocardiopsis sp. CNR-923]